MKAILTLAIGLLLFGNDAIGQDSPEVLLGTWKLDMSPHITDDDNFAMMEITKVTAVEQ